MQYVLMQIEKVATWLNDFYFITEQGARKDLDHKYYF